MIKKSACFLLSAFLFGLLSFFPADAISQPTQVFAFPVQSKAHRARLHKVAQQLRTVRVLRASFQQIKHIKALTRPLRSQGKLLFARSIGVYWQTLTPFPSAILLTQQKLVEKDPTTGQTHAQAGPKPLMQALSQIFIAIIAVDIAQLSKLFHLYLQGDAKQWVLGLRPLRPELKQFIRSVVLEGQKTIQRVTIVETNGDRTQYMMSQVRTRPSKLTPAEKKRFQ